jgi:hypothetical protein
MRKLYLLLAVAGFVLPYYFFVRFLMAEGLNLQLLFSQLFANNISAFFAVDLIISAIVFWVFLYRESQRYQLSNWWVYIVVTLVIGLPLPYHCFSTFAKDGLRHRAPSQEARHLVRLTRWKSPQLCEAYQRECIKP